MYLLKGFDSIRLLNCPVEIAKGSGKEALIVIFGVTVNHCSEACLGPAHRTTNTNNAHIVAYSTRESSAMLYLLIMRRTGLSGILCTEGAFISIYFVVASSLYHYCQRLSNTYKSIVGDNIFSVGARLSGDGTKRLR